MDALLTCTHIAKDLFRFGVLIEESLAASGWRGEVSGRWLVDLHAKSTELLDRCRFQADLLAEIGIEVQPFNENLAEAKRAFAALSLRVSDPRSPAVALLLARLVYFLHAGFQYLGEVAQEGGFEQLEHSCKVLADRLARPATRRRPYALLRTYWRHLEIFAQFRQEPDPLQALRRVYPQNGPDKLSEPSYRFQAFTEAAHNRSPVRLEPYIDASAVAEITTPIVIPDVLADTQRLNDRTYRVWYGTDRAPIHPRDPGLGFAANADTQLHFGSCLVFVPRSHQAGSLGSSWVVRTFFRDADDRLQLQLIKPLTPDTFRDGIAAELARRRDSRTALVYVHGFNVTFEQAALRAAQLACDLSVNGIAAFYSWASAGSIWDYARDEETVRLAVDHFAQFLDTLLETTGLERLDILAHSMGNRLLAAVIQRLEACAQRVRIGHLILAAPDIGRSEFGQVSRHYGAVARRRVTLYSCAKDRALALSTRLHDYLRIGDEPPVYCCDGIDTVSANRVKLDILGHGYIASAKPVIADLKMLLWDDLAPLDRGLQPLPDANTPEYWLLPRER